MKKILSAICLLSSITAFSQRNIDVLHYQFNITLNDLNDTIRGTAVIRYAKKTSGDKVSIDLANLKDGKGMLVTTITGSAENKPATFTHTNDKVEISTGDLSEKDTGTVIINYRGIPSDGLIISKNKYGHRTFFADHWPNRAHNWLPCVDDPADKASVEFIVTAPAHYQVISNGIQIEETTLDTNKLTHWREDVALPTKVMVIGVADFAVRHAGDVGCVPVSSWVFPENKEDGFYDYAMARDILSYYIDYIGPYPYKKLANVQSKTIFGGMENAGAIFYFENSVTGKRGEEPLLAHEIVHQWFGDMATEKSFPHLWLSEGFATYLTNVYLQEKHGQIMFRDRMKADRALVIDFVKKNPKAVVDTESSLMDLLNANSYQKGSWVLHMLRNNVGDTTFKKIIKTYYNRYKGRNADTDDFKKIAEEVSGKELSVFFQQWLYTNENPSLDITWKYDAGKKQVNVLVEQLQQVPFVFPLELQLIFPNVMPRTQTVEVTKKKQEFSFAADNKPANLLMDPNVVLLFSHTLKEIK